MDRYGQNDLCNSCDRRNFLVQLRVQIPKLRSPYEILVTAPDQPKDLVISDEIRSTIESFSAWSFTELRRVSRCISFLKKEDRKTLLFPPTHEQCNQDMWSNEYILQEMKVDSWHESVARYPPKRDDILQHDWWLILPFLIVRFAVFLCSVLRSEGSDTHNFPTGSAFWCPKAGMSWRLWHKGWALARCNMLYAVQRMQALSSWKSCFFCFVKVGRLNQSAVNESKAEGI